MTDLHWMQEAIAEAKKAYEENEVPVGTVIVLDNKIIGRGHNRTETLKDPTAHAEIIAISAAATYLNSWRLANAVVYSTLEPCLMCSGALVLSRVKKLVYGADDMKFGACGSVYNIPLDNKFNHRFDVIPGVLSEECQKLIKDFFRKQRENPGYHKSQDTTRLGDASIV
jgi:tRNA(adenine34) deaminase